MSADTARNRVPWVDAAKGLCIVLVVLMHATLRVEMATGTPTVLNGFIEWARPFRMPDFFLISGLFLAARISRPWPSYLDTKVVYFAYFYILWLTIQVAAKSPKMIATYGLDGTIAIYLMAFVQPSGTLWFIYLLAVFFVAAKLMEVIPKAIGWTAAAILYLAAPETGWVIADEFTSRFVFFYTGYWAAPAVFAFATWIRERTTAAVFAGLVVWSLCNWLLVRDGFAFVKGADILVSYAGIAAVIAFSVITESTCIGRAFSALGRNSIRIYLAFPLFLAPAIAVALQLNFLVPATGAALISTAAGVVGALVFARLAQGTHLSFLFERPKFAQMGSAYHLTSRLRKPPANLNQS